jgi:hypothetical protein
VCQRERKREERDRERQRETERDREREREREREAGREGGDEREGGALSRQKVRVERNVLDRDSRTRASGRAI